MCLNFELNNKCVYLVVSLFQKQNVKFGKAMKYESSKN